MDEWMEADKTCLFHMTRAKTQISTRIRAVWSLSDQRLCYSLHSVVAISAVPWLLLASVAKQTGLCLTWSPPEEFTFPHDESRLIPAGVEILLNHSVTVGNVVSLIEGNYAELKCMSSDSNAVIRWQKTGDPAFLINDPKLAMQSVQRSHAGEYTCIVKLSTGKEAEQTVTVNVLCKYTGWQYLRSICTAVTVKIQCLKHNFSVFFFCFFFLKKSSLICIAIIVRIQCINASEA